MAILQELLFLIYVMLGHYKSANNLYSFIYKDVS